MGQSTHPHASNKAVFAIFKDRSDLESAVDMLKTAGFNSSDISVLMSDKHEAQKFAHENSTKAPEGTAAGAAGGLVLGGTLGWLAGAGALAIPGIGPFVAAGPIMAAIAGAGIGGTVGGVTGALVGLGIPEYEAKRYEAYVRDGGLLISVHAVDSERIDRAKEILKSCEADDISVKSEESQNKNIFGKDKDDATPRDQTTRY